jgi:phosphatidylinositol 4-kinase
VRAKTNDTASQSRPLPSRTAPDLSTPPNVSLDQLPLETDTDPFSVEEVEPPSHVARFNSRRTHYHSSPDLSHLAKPVQNGHESLLANYTVEKQSQLLKSHYTRSEIRFLLVLEDISNRLLVVPKPARVPALRAELTSLNHNLPAEVRIYLAQLMPGLHAFVVYR